MTPEFKVGDVVRLRSSDWRMTVEGVDVDGEGYVELIWMDRHGDLLQARAVPETLVLVDARS